jgi:transposase
MLDGLLWVLRTGPPWLDLPRRFGPWQTVFHYFTRWRKDGTFNQVLTTLQIRLDKQSRIDWDLWAIDGSIVRAALCAGGASKKVAHATATSRQTTHWVAAEADSPASSTLL